MPMPKSPRYYSDVKVVLDLALKHGGGRYKTESHKAAIRWRFRAYCYRTLLAKLDGEGNPIPGYAPVTPYDEVELTIDDSTVIIEFREPKGIFTPADGDAAAVITRESIDEAIETDWDAAAAALIGDQDDKEDI